MKSVNPLRTKVLITTDEVIFHAPVENTPDVRIILQSILVAEQRFIRPALGGALYDSMCDLKNTLVEEANLAQLTTEINAARPADRQPVVLKVGDYVNSVSGLTPAQSVLWVNHLHKVTAECVYFCALLTNHARFSNKGMTEDNPRTQVGTGGATSIDQKTLRHLMDRTLQDRINPLLDAMHNYMCGVAFPGYLRACSCDEPAGRKTDIMFSMYDEDEDCRCKW